MGFFYLLNEYTDRYHSDFNLGKKFARTVIIGFILYYLAYFILTLYGPLVGHKDRIQHFLKYLIVIDILGSSIFYGGVLNSLSFWSTGEKNLFQKTAERTAAAADEVEEHKDIFKQNLDNIDDDVYSSDYKEDEEDISSVEENLKNKL